MMILVGDDDDNNNDNNNAKNYIYYMENISTNYASKEGRDPIQVNKSL